MPQPTSSALFHATSSYVSPPLPLVLPTHLLGAPDRKPPGSSCCFTLFRSISLMLISVSLPAFFQGSLERNRSSQASQSAASSTAGPADCLMLCLRVRIALIVSCFSFFFSVLPQSQTPVPFVPLLAVELMMILIEMNNLSHRFFFFNEFVT